MKNKGTKGGRLALITVRFLKGHPAAIIVICSLALALGIVEIGLRAREYLQKKTAYDYPHTLKPDGLNRGGKLQENLDIQVIDGYGGKVRWRNNAAGFRNDQEFGEHPAAGVLRILSLGDSFTAGYRVDQEQTFSYLLERWLCKTYGPAEVLVSAIEEPATGYYYLTRDGVRFHPHIVLLGLTLGNDIVSTYCSLDPRGAYRLQKKDNEVVIEQAPGNGPRLSFRHDLKAYDLPPAYLQSRSGWSRGWFWACRQVGQLRLVRLLSGPEEAIRSWYGDTPPPKLFDPFNGLGVFTNPAPLEIEEAYRRLYRLLEAYQTFCDRRGILFAVLVFPQRYQVQGTDWEKAVAKYGLNPSAFDLLAPNRRIRTFCQERGIRVIDPTVAMADRYAREQKSLYFPRGDMHWNREGHLAFFQGARSSFGELAAATFLKVKDVQGNLADTSFPADGLYKPGGKAHPFSNIK